LISRLTVIISELCTLFQTRGTASAILRLVQYANVKVGFVHLIWPTLII
jgi:hypothetical protein